MDPQFKTYVQQHLDYHIGSQTANGQWVNGIYYSSGRDGGFSGKVPPLTPEQSHQTLEDGTRPFKPSGWSLDVQDAEDMIALADKIYDSYYADWGHIPLAGDAPPAVVAWWNSVHTV